MAKQKTLIVEERRSRARSGDGVETVAQALTAALMKSAAYTVGDQERPCAILWTDPDFVWDRAIPELRVCLQRTFIYGTYDQDTDTGPAIWLRCVAARIPGYGLPAGEVPVFYLPGVSRQKLRDVEDCPPELQPLVELQFRGIVWAHPNGKDWTPYAFLTSQYGGLGLEVEKDAATAEALLRALPQLMREKLADLQGRRLDAAFFNALLTPDLPANVLRWMDDPPQFRIEKDPGQWKAFCQQCVYEYRFDPEKDGELRAAELLGRRTPKWEKVWARFTEAPHRYSGVVHLLERVSTPADVTMLNQGSWPLLNQHRESELSQALLQLKNRTPDEARKTIRDLEKEHGSRREWVWAQLGRSQLALALEHLNRLADLTEKPLAAASADQIAELYANAGWETDAAAVEALMCCGRLEQEEPTCLAVRSILSDWLDASARNLQRIVKSSPKAIRPRLAPVEASNGRVLVFADGLRFDLARLASDTLRSQGLQVETDWDWSPFPSVTPTGKPFVSPIADRVTGVDAGDEFGVTIAKSGQLLNSERFQQLLNDCGVQVLKNMAVGDPSGKAWTEIGEIDEHGHNEGWKLAKSVIQDVQNITDRVVQLLNAGWKEALVVTDHGWLLLPGGLPKVEMPKFLAEHRWGRCAALKTTSNTELPVLPWYWKPEVQIASPPGIGCFKAGAQYAHGGISPQELVVPRMVVRATGMAHQSRLAGIKWVGLRCRVTVQDQVPGLKVDLRTRQVDTTTSKVEGGVPRDVGDDGTASLPVGDDRDQGIEVEVVLIGPNGTILHSLRTHIGGSE